LIVKKCKMMLVDDKQNFAFFAFLSSAAKKKHQHV
jgi:hypothetical protein